MQKAKTDKGTVRPRVLLVEDDPNLSIVIQDYLELEHFETVLARDGEDGLAAFHRERFDLVILDVMLPRKDGFHVAEEIRRANDRIPLIFLTARSMNEDRIRGFKAGGDDYITKPFSTEELSLRIKAILKRSITNQLTPPDKESSSYKIGNYTFDFENMRLSIGNKERSLTRKEAALLRILCIYKNRLLAREVALKSVWGDDDYFIGRSMDVFITKLRKYLSEDPDISINNVHGTGFKLEVREPAD